MLTAKLFNNGQSQAVRLPKSCHFNGTEVYIKKIGQSILLIPKHAKWSEFNDSLNLFSLDYMDEREQIDVYSRNK